MLVGCVAGRFAATLAKATLRKHALSGTQGFNCIVVFYLWIMEQTVYFILFCFHVCEPLFSYSSDFSVVMSSACYF